MSWLADDFTHPAHVELASGHHLRPIRADDVAIDYPAVMGSQASLWAKYGAAWEWPPTTMTYEQDRDDLARHEAEIAAQETFNYAVLDAAETELLGCVYIDPPEDDTPGGCDALVSWWLVNAAAGTELQRELDAFVPRWLRETWGFQRPHVFP